MAEKILITGISGFVGRVTARLLLKKKYELLALVRPGTTAKRVEEFMGKVEFVEADLAKPADLMKLLPTLEYDIILHIGALRGGRRFKRQFFWDANVNSTEILANDAYKRGKRFVFCSSVGVFGAIPQELPASERSPRQHDNWYHHTKIAAEKIILNLVLKGLDGYIVRPSITYGEGDYGFPYGLVNLIKKRFLRLPKRKVRIHLTNADLLAEAFCRVCEGDLPERCYIVADHEPVELLQLADFICERLGRDMFVRKRLINPYWFDLGASISRRLRNELFTARFELLSKDWYYDVAKTYQDLNLRVVHTIPAFKVVTDWVVPVKEPRHSKEQ